MKRKLLLAVLLITCGITVTACSGEKEPEDAAWQTEQATEQAVSEETEEEEPVAAEQTEENAADEPVTEENTEQEPVAEENTTEAAWTFADLSKYSYEFSSGAGGWSTNFTIEKDGTFRGNYHDSDMGCTGEGYERGTCYWCSFNGSFKNLRKVDELCYEMELDTVSYENEPGTNEIIDNVLYEYTEWYGLEGTDVYKVYLPGTDISGWPEAVRIWVQMAVPEGGILDRPIIVNEPNQYGIYSYDRLSPKEEAESVYQLYKETYDNYLKENENCNSTVELQENAGNRFRVADQCLNELWNILKYNTEEAEFQEILEEQRAWIEEKEAKAEAAGAGYEGGTLGSVVYGDILAEETMTRCTQLLEYMISVE